MSKLKNTALLIMTLSTINSCSGQTKKSTTDKEILNECWTEPNGSQITFDSDRFLSFMDTNPERTYSAFGGGTYIYQSETGEIFMQISDMNVTQQVNDTVEHKVPWKRYFSIIEMNDSSVLVHTIPIEYEIDWKLDSKGKYQLFFVGIEIDHLPYITKTYKRRENKK